MNDIQILQDLNNRGRGLKRRLEEIDQSEIGRQYPQVRAGHRVEAVASWAGEMLAYLQHLEKEVLPARREERRKSIADAQERLRRGDFDVTRPENSLLQLATSSESWRLHDVGHVVTAAAETFGELLDAVERLTAATQLNTTFAMRSAQLTEDLATAIAEYRRAATGEPEEFPWRAWAADRTVLTTILRARAAQGDARAEFAARSLTEIEETLLAAATPGSGALLSDLDRLLPEIRAAVDTAMRSGAENLAAVDEIMGGLARTLQRREGRDPLAELRLEQEERAEKEAEQARARRRQQRQ